ncbi:MAG: DUF4337 domain-containing protein [Bacteroidota bacterium]
MAEEKKEKWTTFLAISTILIAVCATLSTFKGGGFSTQSLLNQSKASDEWAHYQSKGIKGYLYELQKDKLQLELDMINKENLKPNVLEEYETKIAYYSKSIKKYEEDKKEISALAKSYEDQRDENKAHSKAFGIAVIFLQVSILLSSISALLKKKYIWFLSLAIAVVGIFYFVDGFLLFI